MVGFIFGGNTGETAESLARKRAMIERLMTGDGTPKTAQEGWARVMSSLGGAIGGYRLDQQQKAGADEARKTFADIAGGIFGQTPASSAASSSSIPTPGMGAQAAATAPAASLPTGENAASIREGLIQRGLPGHVADAFIANFQDESGLNPDMNERAPLVPGSRGGYGLYQLTGPRRVAYEKFAQARGVAPSDTNAQLDFLMTELQGPEAAAAKGILSAPDTATAAQAIARDFLRPAKQHLDKRLARYAGLSGSAQPSVEVASADPSASMAYAPQGQSNSAAAAIEAQAPGSGYVDPSLSVQPRQAMPPLEAPREVASLNVAAQPAQQGNSNSPFIPKDMRAQPQTQVAQAQTNRAPGVDPRLFQILSSPFTPPDIRVQAEYMLKQQMQAQQAAQERAAKQADPAYQAELDLKRLQADEIRNPKMKPSEQANLDLNRQKFDFERDNSQKTNDIKEYLFAQERGYTGTFPQWQIENKKASASSVTVNNQDQGEFSKKAAARNVERFGALADAGTQAASVAQSMPVMRELLSQAPQGPIQGRLAEMFPGISSAGDAFMAQVNQIAPTLRVPGSGAQSDRDMDILMGSFPRLSRTPEANQIILNVFEKKAAMNAERGSIAAAALRGEISPEEADRKISDLDKTPLLDERTRSLFTQPSNGGQQVAPPKYGTVQDGYMFKGGNPADPNSWEKIL